MQSKKQTHIEVTINQIVGIIIGWMIVYFIFPYLNGLQQSVIATISSIMFFISSYLRSYIIRRIFNKF